MASPSLKLDITALQTQREFPIFNLLTRVLIESLCPILRSEIAFGDVQTTESQEKFTYWIDALVSGDMEGIIGVGSDAATLRNLAQGLNLLDSSGKPDLKQALAIFHESLAGGLEKQFAEEDFRCELKRGSGLIENHTFSPPAHALFICPIETRYGSLKAHFALKPNSPYLIEELSGRNAALEPRKIRVYASQLESIYTNVKQLESIEAKLLSGPHVRSQMRAQIKKLKRMLHQLKSESLEMLFVPARKLVSDIAKQQGKQIQFTTHGTWLYLDKTLLNNLYEPILHLIRNSVDHGIEEPSERERQGKPAIGTIKCLASFGEEGLKLILSDDGRGLDFARIRERAVLRGLSTAEEVQQLLSPALCELIFQPGFSTRDRADSISGRGLGLDIVRKGIDSMGGTVRIVSTSNHGTSFEVKIPLSEDLTLKAASPFVPVGGYHQEEEEKSLLIDELAGYFERLERTLGSFNGEELLSAAYEGFRLVHSIKGAAGFLGWNRVASFCHPYEELLKLISEKKVIVDDSIAALVLETGVRLKEFCDASKNESLFSLFSVRRLESRIQQVIWAATHSEERTHLFLGKYHLAAVEKFLAPLAAGGTFRVTPEADFQKAVSQPYGALVQFSGDRRGYAGLLLPETAFTNLIHPFISGANDKDTLSRMFGSLTEFAQLMGGELSDLTHRIGIALQPSAPLTYYGFGQPLRILGNPTYCYACEVNQQTFYLAGDFRLPQELGDAYHPREAGYQPTMIIQEAMRQAQTHFERLGLQVSCNQVSTQSDLIGFDAGITSIIACVAPGKSMPDSILFLSYEGSLAHFVHQATSLRSERVGKLDLYDCLNEVSNEVGGMLVAELEKRKNPLKLSLPSLFIGKAFVANFNRLFVTSKMVGTTPKGKFEIQILVTHLAD